MVLKPFKKLDKLPTSTGAGFLNHQQLTKKSTLPKTNIAPKKWWLPIGISFSRGLFSGDTLVSGRVSARAITKGQTPRLSPSESFSPPCTSCSPRLVNKQPCFLQWLKNQLLYKSLKLNIFKQRWNIQTYLKPPVTRLVCDERDLLGTPWYP